MHNKSRESHAGRNQSWHCQGKKACAGKAHFVAHAYAGIYGREFGQVNMIWRLEIADLTIVHWGDNGPLTPELAAAIGDVDILMLLA